MTTVGKVSRPIICTMIGAGVLLLIPSGLEAGSTLTPNKPSAAYDTGAQNDDTLAAALVSSLSSDTSTVRTNAEKKLIAFAQTSSARRDLVIKKLLSSVGAQEELDGTHPILKVSFLYWKSVTNIFAELDAREAVDVLIKCVHCSSGWGGNMGEPPASNALVRMGKPILPRLSDALKHEPDAYKRIKIVLCIARIGGSEAITILQQSLRHERHKDVRNIIKFNLSEMKVAR